MPYFAAFLCLLLLVIVYLRCLDDFDFIFVYLCMTFPVLCVFVPSIFVP